MDVELRNSFPLAGNVTLRTYREDDADAVYEAVIANAEPLRPFMHWMTPDYSADSAREFVCRNIREFQERRSAGYGIFREKEFIGAIGFVSFDEKARKTELGYWISKCEEGKGIVSAACEVLLNYAFRDLGLNRVEIRCSAENRRSAAIPERLGFTKEGLLRKSEYRDGRLHDFVVYGLLADEWPERERNSYL